MKQLLFLLLFPCLAMAQYPGNAGQKLTLGEQTTADGLVYRGVAADTTRKPSVDTMAFILLDTNTNIIWQYKKATNNAWTRVGGSISSGVTGVLPVANGGTNASTLAANKVMVGNGTSGVLTPTELNWDNTNKRLGINTSSPVTRLHLNNNGLPVNSNLVNSAFDLTINSHESAGIRLITSNNSGSAGLYNFINAVKSRGTNENPLTPLLNDFIFGILSNAYDGSSSGGGTAGIFFIADANVSAGVAPQRISFLTSETNNVGRIERLIIKPNGNIGIGTASPLSKLNVMGTVRINSAAAPDANYFLQLNDNSAQLAKARSWDTYSDKRTKSDIQPILNAIDKVNLLNPVYYQKHDSYVENDFLNIDFDSSVKSLGFIAQEVYNVIPEAVNTGTTNELWAMDYTKLIPILTKAIQEQQSLIKALEQRILILENK